MIFRHTLIHADLGNLQIREPAGFKDIRLTQTRNPDFKSLWETFEGEFMFYEDALDRIREAIDDYGPDTTLEYLAEVAIDGFTWQKLLFGQLALDGIRENDDNTALVPIIKTDLTTKFKNRYETPVDINSEEDLDGNPVDIFDPITLELLGQKIQKVTSYNGYIVDADDVQYDIEPDSEAIDADGVLMLRAYYTQVNVKIEQDEISESFDTLLDWVLDPNDIAPAVELDDESGDIVIDIEPFTAGVIFTGILTADSVEPDPSVVNSIQISATVNFQKNDDAPIVVGLLFSDISAGGYTTPVPGFPTSISRTFILNYLGGSLSTTVQSGDRLKVYIRYGLAYSINVGADDGVIDWGGRALHLSSLNALDLGTMLSFKIQSEFPNNTVETFLLHDVAGQTLDRIVGGSQVFYSELLGSDRTAYRQYDADGCHWRKALIKGLQIRNYTLFEKPFFISFRQWWEGINPILNLGLGYETINGREVLRVEGADEFFKNEIVVRISNVKEIVKSFDPEEMVKTVRIGYKQWQSENIAGIDDPQTKHTYASRLQKFGKDITIESEFIAASLAIETTRRTTRKKSTDYKFDDNTFIIALAESGGSPDTSYVPERDEHFSSVTNLLNADTRYNLTMTPARNFMRWAKSLFGGLQHYVGSFFKFTAGEGNYDMTSNYAVSDGCGEYDSELSEKQDIEVTDEYIHRGELCEFTCKLDLEDYLLIKANSKNAIGVSQTDIGHQVFFIKELAHPLNGETTVQAWPVNDFKIKQIESPVLEQVCIQGEVDVCEDAYLTELGDEYITQDNECLVLN